MSMQQVREQAVTDEVIASFAGAPSKRLREVMGSLVRHLHDFAREVRVTEAEWQRGIAFLTRVGHTTTDKRQEFILLSDVLGLSMLTVAINAPATTGATESTVFGPFFVEDAPEVPLGGDIARGAKGSPCYVAGTVRSADGTPLPGARIEVWEADEDGFYDVQYADGRSAGRAWQRAGADGDYRFWSVLPAPYPIPDDGPVGDLLRAADRSPMRPAHLHYKVDAPGHRTLITHIFVAGDKYLASDAVFGVKNSLIVDATEHPAGIAPDGSPIDGPYHQIHFDMSLHQRHRACTTEGSLMTIPSDAAAGAPLDTAPAVPSGDLETDVLIIGSGPAGGAAALALATLGVEHMVLTKYRWTANTPRAHITNQRTMEVFRDLGIEGDVLAQAAPHELMGDTVFCTSLTGDEFGRVRTWGTHPAREADYILASPTLNCDIPQTLLEPIIVGHAATRGSRIRFDTEYLGLTQDADGVDVQVRDRITGARSTIRAKYVIGADGGRSQVAADIGLPIEGQMDIAGSMNIVFHADLSHLVEHRPSVLYWVLQPGADVGGIGLGLVRMVRPWNEWLIVWGYDITEPPPDVDDELATRIVHQLVGDDTIPVTIRSTSLWGNNKMYATSLPIRAGVLHRRRRAPASPVKRTRDRTPPSRTPTTLPGSSPTCCKGKAGARLLDSYDAERAPIGKQIVLRANKSIEEFGAILQALGFDDTSDAETMQARIADRVDNTPQAARKREALRKALELKDYEFNAHGVELGQRYTSAAVIPDGTPEPAYTRDAELYYHPTTWPGARLPHVWLG